MTHPTLAKNIIALKDADLTLRKELIQKGILSDGYNVEMEKLHIKNAQALDKIIDEIGYPTISKVGTTASEAAWLIIQHAISLPTFMKKCCRLLQEAVANEGASAINLAYLTDRIAVNEGRPQLYGTQFDWDHNNEMSPQAFDGLNLVNERRKSLGLNTLEEQTLLMRKRVLDENDNPPIDPSKKNREREAWRIAVGWVAADD